MFGRKPLDENDDTLADCGIEADAKLMVIIRLMDVNVLNFFFFYLWSVFSRKKENFS